MKKGCQDFSGSSFYFSLDAKNSSKIEPKTTKIRLIAFWAAPVDATGSCCLEKRDSTASMPSIESLHTGKRFSGPVVVWLGLDCCLEVFLEVLSWKICGIWVELEVVWS